MWPEPSGIGEGSKVVTLAFGLLRNRPDLLKLAREFNLKVVCTNDVHYVRAEDAGPHDARASRNDASVADALVPADTGTYMIQFQKWRCDGTFANNRLGIAWYQAP